MHKTAFVSGTILAALAVVLGAFGAHALKTRLAAEQLQVFETGVRYQVYHSLALILLAIAADKLNLRFANYSALCFLAGIVLFSGSLYLLSCKSLLGIEDWKFLGPVTPLGGLSFISGWIFLLVSFLKK